MPQVEFTGWRRGFNKVHFTLALRDHTDLGLKASKQITDTILDDVPVAVTIADMEQADTAAW